MCRKCKLILHADMDTYIYANKLACTLTCTVCLHHEHSGSDIMNKRWKARNHVHKEETSKGELLFFLIIIIHTMLIAARRISHQYKKGFKLTVNISARLTRILNRKS